MDFKSVHVFLKPGIPRIKIESLILLVCIIALGFNFIYTGGRSMYRCYQAATWLQTPGVVTSSEKIFRGYTPKIKAPIYVPKITYTYVIRGVTYSASRLRFGLRASKDPIVTESIMKRYPIGAKITVYFNDANPKEAVLERDLGSGAVSNFGIGALLLVIAGFWLKKIAERRKKYKDQFPLVTRILDELRLQIPEGNGEIRAQVWITNCQERPKISNWKEVGILVLGSDKISLYSANFEGERSTRHYERSSLKTEWVGNQTFSICENYLKIYISASNGLIALSSREQTVDIYRQIAGQNLQVPSAFGFAIEKNPASLTALIIMAGAFIYAVTDGMFINPLEVVGYPDNIILLYIVPNTMFSLLIYLLMTRFSVPLDVRCSLTLLCCLSLLSATLPILQRIDTAQATNSMRLYDYHMVREGNFEPVSKGPPKLKLEVRSNLSNAQSNHNDYWNQFDKNRKFQFLLQEGGLGIWQFDGRELDKDIDAYMKMHPKKRKESSKSN